MIPSLKLLLQALLIGSIIAMLKFSSATAQTKPGCASSCGNLTNIPFPFGTGDDSCHLTDPRGLYTIDCSQTDRQGNPLPYWITPNSNGTVKSISLEKHEMTIMVVVARDCYNAYGQMFRNAPSLRTVRFPISPTKNKFTAVGCDTYAVLSGRQESSYSTGCLSLCSSIEDVTNGSCSGIGCCQTGIPKDVTLYKISLTSYYNHTGILDFNPCSYSFVAENDYFNFSTQSLLNMPEKTVPLVLEWSIGSQTCEDALKDQTSYMCKAENSFCFDATNGKGYRCNCTVSPRWMPKYVPVSQPHNL